MNISKELQRRQTMGLLVPAPTAALISRFIIVSRRMIVVLLLLLFTLFFSQNSPAEIPPKQIFELKHVSKGQDIYIIQIFSDGKVHYQGFKAVVNGDHYAQMTQEQLYDLTIYFLSLPFEATKKNEDKRGGESWRKTIDFKSTYVRVYINDTVFYSVAENLGSGAPAKRRFLVPDRRRVGC